MRVSKDGRRRGRAASILRDAVLRMAPLKLADSSPAWVIGIERRAELARKVNDHEYGSRKIGRKFAGQEAQRLETSRGSADGENVAMSHANGTHRGGI